MTKYHNNVKQVCYRVTESHVLLTNSPFPADWFRRMKRWRLIGSYSFIHPVDEMSDGIGSSTSFWVPFARRNVPYKQYAHEQ